MGAARTKPDIPEYLLKKSVQFMVNQLMIHFEPMLNDCDDSDNSNPHNIKKYLWGFQMKVFAGPTEHIELKAVEHWVQKINANIRHLPASTYLAKDFPLDLTLNIEVSGFEIGGELEPGEILLNLTITVVPVQGPNIGVIEKRLNKLSNIEPAVDTSIEKYREQLIKLIQDDEVAIRCQTLEEYKNTLTEALKEIYGWKETKTN